VSQVLFSVLQVAQLRMNWEQPTQALPTKKVPKIQLLQVTVVPKISATQL
jgi:hypothetical protein